MQILHSDKFRMSSMCFWNVARRGRSVPAMLIVSGSVMGEGRGCQRTMRRKTRVLTER